MGWDRKKKKIGNLHGDKCCKEHRAWGWKRSLRVRFSSKRIRKGFIKKMTSVQRYEGSEGAAMGKSALGRGDQCRALPSQCGFSSLHINGTAFLKCTNDFLIVGGETIVWCPRNHALSLKLLSPPRGGSTYRKAQKYIVMYITWRN